MLRGLLFTYYLIVHILSKTAYHEAVLESNSKEKMLSKNI